MLSVSLHTNCKSYSIQMPPVDSRYRTATAIWQSVNMKFWKLQLRIITRVHICNFIFFASIYPTQFRSTRGYGARNVLCICENESYVWHSFGAVRARCFHFDIIACRTWNTLERHFATYIPEMYSIRLLSYSAAQKQQYGGSVAWLQ